MFKVVLSDTAKSDIRRNTVWWQENRSDEQAERWYDSIITKIYSLDQMPERCPFAPEAIKLKMDLRNLLFGVSTNYTHRVLFQVDDDTVYVFRVLHGSQIAIEDADDLD